MSEIKKRPLGRTGFEVSELGLGTWPLGGTSYDAVGEDDAIACIETYLDAGGNFIDTASNKAYGLAQFFIGKVLAKRKDRKNLFIASKTPNSASLDTLPNIQVDLEESLRVMGIDYLDLYYLHWPPSEADVMNRILDEYERFKAEGKIRAIGASIKGPSVTQETLDLCRQYIDTGRVDVIQVVYSMFRQMNKEIFDYAVGKGVGIVARTALESGILTGKYRPGHRFTKGHRANYSEQVQEAMLKAVEYVENLALKPPYEKAAHVAIKFSLEPQEISSLLLGARNAKQVEELLHTVSLPDLAQGIVEKLKADYGQATLQFNPGEYTPGMMK